MIRKMLVIAAAVAMPVSVVAVTVTSATAATPKVDATNYTVSCTGIAATASFKPALTTAGVTTPTLETTKISGKATGCTATPTAGGTAVAITGATITGTLTNSSSNLTCGGLATPTTEAGSLTVKWKSNPKLTATSSVATPTSVAGGIGADGHATFGISFSGVTGPFQGTDSGASSTNDAETTTTIAQILNTCNKGLKSIKIQPDANNPSNPAIHLG